MVDNRPTSDESADEYSRRTAMKTMGVAGVGLAGTVLATGDAEAAGPTAVIEADLPIEDPEEVTFDGSNSTGSIQSYEWYVRNNNRRQNYPDSPLRTGPSFSETFGTPISVKLVVTDDSGNTDTAETDFIAGNTTTPTARIDRASPETTDGNQTFVGRNSTAPNSTITSYEWYIRNDESSNGYGHWDSGPSFALAFADNQYTVKLEVTNDEGETATDTVTFQGQG